MLGAHENLSLPIRKLPRVGLVCWADTYGRESRSKVHVGTGRKRLLENRPWLCLILMCSSPHSFLSHILGAQLMLVGRRKRTIRICPHAPGEFSGTRVCSDSSRLLRSLGPGCYGPSSWRVTRSQAIGAKMERKRES